MEGEKNRLVGAKKNLHMWSSEIGTGGRIKSAQMGEYNLHRRVNKISLVGRMKSVQEDE